MNLAKKCFAAVRLTVLLAGACCALAADDPIRGYSASGYVYVSFGKYPQESADNLSPILWRVLKAQDGSAYLLSEYILDSMPVQEDKKSYSKWDTSDLYAYLNGDFLYTVFTTEELRALKEVDGSRVTLLSADEVRDASMGFEENADHRAAGTAYAKEKGLDSYSGKVRYSPWWLRDVSQDYPEQHRRIIEDGKLGRTGVNSRSTGVRPAVTVLLDMLTVSGGSGAMDDPYVLTVKTGAEAAAALATPVPTPQPTEEPDDDTTPVPVTPEKQEDYSPITADTANMSPLFPAMAEDGFLPEGESEFVLADDKNGVWLYASQTLRIEIHRQSQKSPKLMRWYEAEIWCKPESDMFTTYAFDETKYKNYNRLTNPQNIAKQHHLVFAMNTDFFIYRVGRQKEVTYTYPIGIVIRRGTLMYDVPKKPNSTVYPPLDVAAFYPNGQLDVFLNGATTGKALLESGASDVLSFGPILVENGEVSPRASAFGEVDNPRTAVGMVERGHYYCVLLEGRLASSYSEGGSCIWMADTMERLGCQTAINLDGGQTACMIFMGNRINKIGTYSGSATDKDRDQNELLGIGQSELVK